MDIQTVKCVLVGDTGVGKTSFLLTYLDKRFPGDYLPMVRDDRPVNIMVDETPIRLDLWDSAGDSQYDRLRPIGYQNTDVFLICFSVVDNISFENVQAKWFPEIVSHCPNVPYVLVGTKLDLRDDKDFLQNLHVQGLAPITLSKGKCLANEIKAVKYLECSALLQIGVQDLINEAVRTVIGIKERKTKTECIIT